MFIGRETELQFLEDKYRQKRGQLVVLYGRRRIGKTETLRQFCKGKPHVFFSCRECTDKMQLKAFSEKLLKEKVPAASFIHEFADWETAFRSVPDLPYADQKRLLIIDEFPYMCKGNPAIPSLLQNLWDDLFDDENVMIVLCGSAVGFLEKEVLSEKNPLYGRATGIYKMTEMGFYDAAKFFPDYSERDKVLAYAVLGGIPHYLRQFDQQLSLSQNIKRNILTKGCALYSEPEFLLRQELRETPLYNAIIEAVALGSTRLGDISVNSLVDDTSKTSVYLKNLVDLGIIQREVSVSGHFPVRAGANRGSYRLTDHFFRFWYAFLFTNYSDLESGDVDGVYRYIVEPGLHDFAAAAFADICREYVRRLQKADALPFRCQQLGRWQGRTTLRGEDAAEMAESEIDILGISRDGDQFLVGECKFQSHPFRFSEFANTRARFLPQQEEAQFHYFLFSESGFGKKLTEEAKTAGNITLCSLADIVSGKGCKAGSK